MDENTKVEAVICAVCKNQCTGTKSLKDDEQDQFSFGISVTPFGGYKDCMHLKCLIKKMIEEFRLEKSRDYLNACYDKAVKELMLDEIEDKDKPMEALFG